MSQINNNLTEVINNGIVTDSILTNLSVLKSHVSLSDIAAMNAIADNMKILYPLMNEVSSEINNELLLKSMNIPLKY